MSRRAAAIVATVMLTVLATGIVRSDTAVAQVARNVAEFCGVWTGICRRTCPTSAADCAGVCQSRAAACRSSGCFHFNVPRPRCFNNAEDRRLTDASLAPDPAAERARRAKAQK